MTSFQPSETHHYRRSQTPESPRPLHPPEPSNIPLLQNQMDPGFNDNSNFEPRPSNFQSQTTSTSAAQIPGLSDNSSGVHEARLENGFRTGQQADVGSLNGVAGSNLKPLTADDNEVPQNQAASIEAYDSFPSHAFTSSLPPTNEQASNLLASLASLQQTPVPSLEPSTIVPAGRDYQAAQTLDAATASAQSQSAYDYSSSGMGELAGDRTESAFEVRPSEPSSHADEGVNYQTLLDNLANSPAAATAPSARAITAATTASPEDDPYLPQSATDERSLPTAAGLPPRPPPQEKPAIHPNYSPADSIRSFHQLHAQSPSVPSFQPSQSSYRPNAGLPPMMPPTGAPGTATSGNGLPPPPLATFQQASQPMVQQQQSPSVQSVQQNDATESPILRGGEADDDHPWAPDVQVKYDQFLQDERMYVLEGVWDRFPPGSRLFVGNLPTEKVTKRDLFHIFHKHGKLAQISIKQAYGFVQFLDTAACYQALAAEQGGVVRGRKIHLEISKPQKNSRNAAKEDAVRPTPRRRSRSPERRGGLVSPRGGGPRVGPDRYDRGPFPDRLPFSDFRDEPARRRDDYRPVRSPSPRGYRGREDYRVRDRSPDRYGRRPRSRSPFGRGGSRYRSPSPRSRGYDSDADLPIPRRDPRDVPDVQILILEEVDRNFVFYIENGFRSKGLRSDVLMLSPRITLQAVIKRQIIEGVQAVVKLTRGSQFSGKIPLQVFDRAGGSENVRFNEYVELDVAVAADIVISTKQTQRMADGRQFGQGQPLYGGPQAAPPYPQPQLPSSVPLQQPAAGGPNVSSLISNLDGAALQKLLGALQQPQAQAPGQPPTGPVLPSGPQSGAIPPSSGNSADLASLLSSVARQHHPQPYQQPALSQAPQNAPYAAQSPPNQGPNTGQAYPPVASVGNGPPYGQGSAQNVQNIMEQLARWKQQ